MNEIDIMDIGGFKAGHAQDEKGITGCTVLLLTNRLRQVLI